MGVKVYLHAFYPDIGTISPSVLPNYTIMERLMKNQRDRDASLSAWLKNNNIPAFPIVVEKVYEIMPYLRFLTEKNHLVNLMLTCVDETSGRDVGCKLVKGGLVEDHPSRGALLTKLSGQMKLKVIHTPLFDE
jgi:hypothetical protein